MNFSGYLDCELYLTAGDQARLSVPHGDYCGRPDLDDTLQHRLLKVACEPRSYGTFLFDALFPACDDLLTGYRESLAIARHDGKRLRFRLHIATTAAQELHDLRWELLYDPKERVALGRAQDTAFSRYLSVARGSGAPVSERPRLLFALASPKDLSDYQLPKTTSRQMYRSLEEVLEPFHGQVFYEILSGPITAARVRARLVNGGFHALHLHAHGIIRSGKAETCLVLENEDRTASLVSEEMFSEIFEGQRNLRLVTLVACHSGVQTAADPFSGLGRSLVHRGVPAVIAMRQALSIDAAVCLSESLYPLLIDGRRIDAAVNEARQRLHLAAPTSIEWGTPVLFMRLQDGRLWQRLQTPVAAAASEAIPAQVTIRDNYQFGKGNEITVRRGGVSVSGNIQQGEGHRINVPEPKARTSRR